MINKDHSSLLRDANSVQTLRIFFIIIYTSRLTRSALVRCDALSSVFTKQSHTRQSTIDYVF